MSNRSKKAQFSRSLKKKSIHIGGKSEKVTPPPLKKPTSALNNCTPEEIRNLKERLAQRNELNVLFFHLKQMANFLEADINQFNSDLHLTNKKLSISEKIISPQEHLICERFARKICNLNKYNDNIPLDFIADTYDFDHIRNSHKIINQTKDSIDSAYKDSSHLLMAKGLLMANGQLSDDFDDNNQNNIIGNIIYNDWAASILPILQVQYYMVIRELRSLKKLEPYILANNDFYHGFIYLGQIVVHGFDTTYCNFIEDLAEISLKRQFINKAKHCVELLDTIGPLPEDQNILRNIDCVKKEFHDSNEALNAATALVPSPDAHVSFDDCFDANCSVIDIDKELSQIDLSNDPLLAASLREVYCDFNELLQRQRVAQKKATNIDSHITETSHDSRAQLIGQISFIIANNETLAYAAKPAEQFYISQQDKNLNLAQLLDDDDDIKKAHNILHAIIDNGMYLPYSSSAVLESAVLEYLINSIALLIKERSFYVNINELIINRINNLHLNLDQVEVGTNLFQNFATILFFQDKAIHFSNAEILTDNLTTEFLRKDSPQDFNMIPDINQAADIANLFKVLTRFLHCFIVDDYEFARFIVDAYNKPSLQFELDKLLKEAQLTLVSKRERLKSQGQGQKQS